MVYLKRLNILIFFLTVTLSSYCQHHVDSSFIEVISIDSNFKPISIIDSSVIDTGIVKKVTKELVLGDTFIVHNYYLNTELIKQDRFNENRGIHTITNYKDGKPHGASYTFKNGRIQNYVYYNKWDIITSFSFYENGQLKIFGFKDTLEQVGISKEYYESGKMMVESTQNLRDSSIHEKRYYESGNIIYEADFNAGKQKMTSYYDSGIIMEEYTYIGIDLYHVGEYRVYHENGQPKHHAFYKDGDTKEEANIRTGVWKWWDEEGNLIRQEEYKNNELIDTKEFFPKKMKGVEK